MAQTRQQTRQKAYSHNQKNATLNSHIKKPSQRFKGPKSPVFKSTVPAKPKIEFLPALLLSLCYPDEDTTLIRLEDYLLDEEEAEESTEQIYSLIKSVRKLEVTDHTSRQNALEDEVEAERAKEPTETEGEYERRMGRVSHWVRYWPIREAKWIWRARVVIEAMGLFLGLSDAQHSELKSGALRRFNPKAFYMYSWICLTGGRGVRAWGGRGGPIPPPPLLSKGLSIQEQTKWYYTTALALQEDVLNKWRKGQNLSEVLLINVPK
ncbi:uncharacterized protein N7506_000167 [Penicillium brevicompactum]|uniref:uncharacterized protein n=1 Tax=Penicillium brevicompactum TaxID=5074 RepID=UPI002540075B|nr:uncharacterized protein N7506_000167 [Penicillium brevicompactum]KAJ5346914.1 hypothetical protein N7506_000167 [Penicillium brevicompactum]